MPKRTTRPDVVAGQVDQHHVLGHLLRVLDQLALEPAVLLGCRPAAPRAGDGPGDDRPVAQPDHGLGRGPDHGHLGEAEEVEVRARVDQAQHPVDVEGVGAEVAEVEALGQHDLEDVAGDDVLLGRPHRVLVAARRTWCGATSPGGRVPRRQRPGRLGRAGRKQSAASCVEPGLGLARGPRRAPSAPQAGSMTTLSIEHHPLAPVVEGGQLADDRQDGVGVAEVVGRRVGQVLDLPDHVVAEVADQAGVQRRQVGEVGRVEGVEDGLEGGQHPAGAAHPPAGDGVEVDAPRRW